MTQKYNGSSGLRVGDKTRPSHVSAVYQLEQKLGEGRSGVVFQGYNTADVDEDFSPEDVEHFAIKFFKEDLNERTAQMLRREVAIQRKIISPHLANVEDYSTDPEQLYIVMEYVPETLFGLFCRNVINQKVIMNLIRQASLLLRSLQDAGVVHLDFKPNNVGYQGEVVGKKVDLDDYEGGSIIALDYGLALLLPPDGHLTVSHGGTAKTLPYSAPEFVQVGEVNKTTDTYGMGKVLEWTLTGLLSQSVAEFRDNIISYHRVKPPQSLIEMYATMTASDSAGRPSPEELKSIANRVITDLETGTFLFGERSIQNASDPMDVRQIQSVRSSVDNPTSLELLSLEQESFGSLGSLELLPDLI